MEEDGAGAAEMQQLQAGAAAKQADFETRKKARLTAGGGGDQGEQRWAGFVGAGRGRSGRREARGVR